MESRNNIIWYAFYSKFATFKNFEKNQIFKKTLILYVFKKSYYFSHIFYGQFALIWG